MTHTVGRNALVPCVLRYRRKKNSTEQQKAIEIIIAIIYNTH